MVLVAKCSHLDIYLMFLRKKLGGALPGIYGILSPLPGIRKLGVVCDDSSEVYSLTQVTTCCLPWGCGGLRPRGLCIDSRVCPITWPGFSFRPQSCL